MAGKLTARPTSFCLLTVEHAVCSAWAENDFHCPAISSVISLLVEIATLNYVIHFALANEMQRSESESSSPFGEIFLSVRQALIANLKPFLSRSSTFVTMSKPGKQRLTETSKQQNQKSLSSFGFISPDADAICMFTFAGLQTKQ